MRYLAWNASESKDAQTSAVPCVLIRLLAAAAAAGRFRGAGVDDAAPPAPVSSSSLSSMTIFRFPRFFF